MQFLVIWYGNLPEETRYVILRVKLTPWEPVAWMVLGMIFAIPFVLLLSRKIKMKPLPMMILSGIILAGMWLERFILVAPSIWKGEGIPMGLLEVLITAGFFRDHGAEHHRLSQESSFAADLRSAFPESHRTP